MTDADADAGPPAGSGAAGPPPLVPDGFVPPAGLVHARFLLEPLGPEHNASDHDAWSSSVAHIRATPGWETSSWPVPMTLEENRADLERHARDFATRRGFTYTVLDPRSRAVIGCVYLYPSRDAAHDADVRSWVRADRAHLEGPLRRAVADWLGEAWPFARPAYAAPRG